MGLAWIEQQKLYNFVPSNMPQGLQIIETIKGRTVEREDLSKQQRFNLIFDRLRERNNLNDLHIRDFIKKMGKRERHFNRAVERHRLAVHLTRHSEVYVHSNQDDSPLCALTSQFVQLMGMEKHEVGRGDGVQRERCLESTANTAKEEASSPDTKTGSFPTIDAIKSPKLQRESSQPKITKNNFPLAKYDKNFNNYLRNVFFNDIVTKTQQKKRISSKVLNSHELSRKSHQARVHTHAETSPTKYQLSIKEMVFGNEEIIANKRIESEVDFRNRNNRMVTELGEKMVSSDKGEPAPQFFDGNLANKTILPSINTAQTHKNKRCLQNFIKMNNDRARQAKEKAKLLRLSKLEEQAQIICDNQSMSRIGISFRINTIPIKYNK